jgi:hypothetical protein
MSRFVVLKQCNMHAMLMIRRHTALASAEEKLDISSFGTSMPFNRHAQVDSTQLCTAK